MHRDERESCGVVLFLLVWESLNESMGYICAYADSERGKIRQNLRNLHCVCEVCCLRSNLDELQSLRGTQPKMIDLAAVTF